MVNEKLGLVVLFVVITGYWAWKNVKSRNQVPGEMSVLICQCINAKVIVSECGHRTDRQVKVGTELAHLSDE